MNKEDLERVDNEVSKLDSNSSSSSTRVDADNEQPKATDINSEEVSRNEHLKPIVSLRQCTIKDILSEILDCTIVNKPTATPNSTENETERSSKTLSILFPQSRSEATGFTMKEVISRILDYTVLPVDQSRFSETALEENIIQYAEVAGSSKSFERNTLVSNELGILKKKDHILK